MVKCCIHAAINADLEVRNKLERLKAIEFGIDELGGGSCAQEALHRPRHPMSTLFEGHAGIRQFLISHMSTYGKRIFLTFFQL